jgi:hypothetical protein
MKQLQQTLLFCCKAIMALCHSSHQEKDSNGRIFIRRLSGTMRNYFCCRQQPEHLTNVSVTPVQPLRMIRPERKRNNEISKGVLKLRRGSLPPPITNAGSLVRSRSNSVGANSLFTETDGFIYPRSGLFLRYWLTTPFRAGTWFSFRAHPHLERLLLWRDFHENWMFGGNFFIESQNHSFNLI